MERWKEIEIKSSAILDLVGRRSDRNSQGAGGDIAVYVGEPSRFHYATHELGDVFGVIDGKVVEWRPDYVEIVPSTDGDDDVRERRIVAATKDDVVICAAYFRNESDEKKKRIVSFSGDCRRSQAWRGDVGGEKRSYARGDLFALLDANVYPSVLPNGLTVAVGAELPPKSLDLDAPGAYDAEYEVTLAPNETRRVLFAAAFDPDKERAFAKVERALSDDDPIESNAEDWIQFYEEGVPSFACSDSALAELYAFRWYLLRFSTAGGDLGYFSHPVVMEGRMAYQTYCCYSAPFMALDMNWSNDRARSFGQIAAMAEARHDDGRFPWYVSPSTNRVPIHHASETGMSLLPYATWRRYLSTRDVESLATLYDGMKANVDWWIANRDVNANGVFEIEHQLETGMDNLYRWGRSYASKPYEAIDATAYCYANLGAVANMAAVLGKDADARRYDEFAKRSARAIDGALWSEREKAFYDLDLRTSELSTDYPAVTMFYPFFAEAVGANRLSVFTEHLFDSDEFWLDYVVPALPKNHIDFDPDGFWEGPIWPAANSHVVRALANAAKRLDRSLLPKAAELFLRTAKLHTRPRADFYERYHPFTGEPLSRFRDYMHSWWIDLFAQHAAGLTLANDGSISVDPLPLGLEWYAFRNAHIGEKRVDVFYRSPDATDAPKEIEPGLTVLVDGEPVIRENGFAPGEEPIPLSLWK